MRVRVPFLVALLLVCADPQAASADPSPQISVQTEAIVTPSIVSLTVHWRAWIRLADGRAVSPQPYTVDTACSGFVASNAGFVVTSGQCVDNETPDGGKGDLLQTAVADLVATHRIRPVDEAPVLRAAQQTWRVEGSDADSPPERTVTVYQAGVALGATVVDFKPLHDGDVGLVKVDPANPMPALEVAAQEPDNGTTVITAGYPDPKREATFTEGRTSGNETVDGVPFARISATNTAGASGGPTVDAQGRVVGTVSFRTGADVITATSSIQSLLARNSVSGALSPQDIAYRAGLADYFAGRYHDAVKQFDTVLAVVPNHALAQSYRSQALARYPDEKLVSPTGRYLLIGGVTLAALVVLAAAIVFLAVRAARRPAASPPPASPPVVGVAAPVPPGSQQCPNCGTPHPSAAHFCAQCGQPFPGAFTEMRSPAPGSS